MPTYRPRGESGDPGVYDDNRSSVSQACRKRREFGAVSRNNRNEGGPVSVLGRAH